MTATYKLSNGAVVSAYLWEDFLQGKNWRKTIEVDPINKNGVRRHIRGVVKSVKEDESGLYFLWRVDNNKYEKVYLEDYIAPSYDELLGIVGNGDEPLCSHDLILASFRKHPDDVCIECEMPIASTMTPLGLLFSDKDKTKTVRCHLSEEDFKKHEWGYKITIEVDPEYMEPGLNRSQVFYFSDLCSMLHRKTFYKLVKR